MKAYNRLNADKENIKKAVKLHWEAEPCESRAGITKGDREKYFAEIDAYRYETSPFIPGFTNFAGGRNKRVLEVGLGSGSDFIRWARHGADLWGVDLTAASVKLVNERLALEGLQADVRVDDVEALEFDDEFFDIVYSYGVIHHTPDTEKAIKEIYRVLKPRGTAKIMIYNARGLTFYYQWILFALLKMKPWKSVREIAFYHNESCGTKLYTKKEANKLFSDFTTVNIETIVDAGDTLNFMLSDRYRKNMLIRSLHKIGFFMKYFQKLIPSGFGTTMLIEATK